MLGGILSTMRIFFVSTSLLVCSLVFSFLCNPDGDPRIPKFPGLRVVISVGAMYGEMVGELVCSRLTFGLDPRTDIVDQCVKGLNYVASYFFFPSYFS